MILNIQDGPKGNLSLVDMPTTNTHPDFNQRKGGKQI